MDDLRFHPMDRRSSRIPTRPTIACGPRIPSTRVRSASGCSPATRTWSRCCAIRASSRRPSPPSWRRASAAAPAASACRCWSATRPTTPGCAGSSARPSPRAWWRCCGPHIQQIVDGLLDRVEAQGAMDVIEDFAYPLPVTVICEMLGRPGRGPRAVQGVGADIARGLDAILLPPGLGGRAAQHAARRALGRLLPRADRRAPRRAARRPALRPHRRRGGGRQAERGASCSPRASCSSSPATRRRST